MANLNAQLWRGFENGETERIEAKTETSDPLSTTKKYRKKRKRKRKNGIPFFNPKLIIYQSTSPPVSLSLSLSLFHFSLSLSLCVCIVPLLLSLSPPVSL